MIWNNKTSLSVFSSMLPSFLYAIDWSNASIVNESIQLMVNWKAPEIAQVIKMAIDVFTIFTTFMFNYFCMYV